MSFVVVDLETTGLSKEVHRITEIAAARLIDGEIIREFQTLVNPGVPIPRFITHLTGIDDKMVKDAPPIQEVLPAFLKFLGPDVFVGHNASFDYGFLSTNAFRSQRHIMQNQSLCTRKLARRLLPTIPDRKLGTLCSHFNIKNEQAHRAMADVKATAGVFCRMQDILKTRGITTIPDMLKFQSLSPARVFATMTPCPPANVPGEFVSADTL